MQNKPPLRIVRLTRWLAGLAMLLGVAYLLLPKPKPSAAVREGPARAVSVVQSQGRAVPSVPLPGERILSGFADGTQAPANDLTLLHRCLDTFLLAAKGMKNEPLSANGEIAAALRGEGRVKVAFLPRSHRIFNAAGALTDRWGTPFFFHSAQAGVIAIRSAGPDRLLWTEDDLHREPNGTFLRGEALNPPSLR
jgi:hypothetical protein